MRTEGRSSVREWGGPGLYVHVPFCQRRCAYCAFCSQTRMELRQDYLEALAREARSASGAWRGFDTVYVGGGTPTALELDQMAALVDSLGCLEIIPGASWTVEANPDDLSPALLRGLRELGFERISIGVQSFDDQMLRLLGRRHDGDAGVRALSMAREAGFQQVSLDLMYALPGQRLDAWQRDLERALTLGPDHLSAYELTLEPGTPLVERIQRGAVQRPDEASARDLFLYTSRRLREAGWLHYEVSSFATSPRHQAHHNRKYWAHVPYLGLGPGAHSFDGDSRWWNICSLPRYIRELRRGRPAVEGREQLDGVALRLERLALGLRTARGVALSDLEGHADVLRHATGRGWLVTDGERAHPTPEGYLWADGLAVDFA